MVDDMGVKYTKMHGAKVRTTNGLDPIMIMNRQFALWLYQFRSNNINRDGVVTAFKRRTVITEYAEHVPAYNQWCVKSRVQGSSVLGGIVCEPIQGDWVS